jgi:DNA polymerase
MQGFFTKQETESDSRPGGKILSCASCGLYKNGDSPRMKPKGNFKKRILNIGEAPGRAEDKMNQYWVGKTGRLLKDTYKELGINIDEDCLNINSVSCYKSKTPTPYEIDCCRKNVLKVIDEYQPNVIMVLGNSALYSVLGKHWKKDLGTITKWRGFTIPDKEYKCWVCPVFHPSYVIREDREVKTVWKQDLKQALNLWGTQLPKYKKPVINYLNNLEVLNDIKSDLCCFDYETTGIKPHSKGHKIICCSIAISENDVYTFLMPNSKKERQPFINFLQNKRITKMAHNMKFEDTWSNVRLRTKVSNWGGDSLLASHILDNRRGICGLKFQTYVNFGVVDYDSEINPYLQSGSKNGNAINKISEVLESKELTKKLLKYCALDSIYQFRLANKQMEIMNYDFLPF